MTGTDHHPIALRPLGDYPARQASVFEDPGDERSWHVSQRSGSLEGFYEGREPSWYASAIAPLAGSRRVLDLGCGPGLTLRALLEQGAEQVLGVDRWPAFQVRGGPEAPIVLHDLTLPMPFLPSESFDAVFSHYVLDYVSPIGVRQILHEANRVLVPGGRLLVYVAAMGLGGGDESRTSPYAAETMTALLEEAGFVELDVEPSPNGRNTVARARRSPGPRTAPSAASIAVEGEVQLCAAFSDVAGTLVRVGVGETEVELAAGARTAVCARVATPVAGEVELQAWSWNEGRPASIKTARIEHPPAGITIECDGRLEMADSWSPAPLAVESGGRPYVLAGELPDGATMTDAERGAEGRAIVVEREPLDAAGIELAVGPGANRFLVRRPEPGDGTDGLEDDWRSGRAFGVVLEADHLAHGAHAEVAAWTAKRQAIVVVEGGSWPEIATAIGRAGPTGPVVAVDPLLTGGEGGSPDAIGELASTRDSVFVVPAAETAGLPTAAVLAGEHLRYLTERTLLMRLRHVSGRSLAEVGRYPS
jgi:SAM-dependent methyltransferase